ncbi:RNA polymerase II associated Paf1 complex [Paramicrosporidium saccamoebae]|uniref:RNA polymerase II associated Paf1 complex n=1 Tax=Paramicrosporidium saccamoebae TaxID=1246581 RepID=A0A2H9TPF6_9FUNG|nr:RNA polymerase II associated Paf1 complex [Paramicrosporidium saccamoebae]
MTEHADVTAELLGLVTGRRRQASGKSRVSELLLAAMAEVEREAVLYERAQARLAKVERRELEKKMRQLESGVNRPARGPSATMEKKRKTLDELRARREKRKRRGSDSDYYDSEEEGELKDKRRQAVSASEDEDNYHSSRQRSPSKKPSTELVDLDTANGLLLRRNTISKWIFHPQFDDLCRGCLLRLSIGFKGEEQIYRLVEIRKIVKYHRNYKINDVVTNKAAVVKYGRSEKTFRMDVVSNSDFIQYEFDRWVETMKEEHQPIITRKTAVSRIAHWKDLESKPVSDEIVSAMVASKRELGSAPRNLISERTMLRHLREEALNSGNSAEVERIDDELVQLDKEFASQSARSAADTRLDALAELNKRNRRLNVANAREAERKNYKRSEADSRHDPFSRRKCQPTNFNVLFDNAESAKEQSGEELDNESQVSLLENQMSILEDRIVSPLPEIQSPLPEIQSPSLSNSSAIPTKEDVASEEKIPAGPIDLFAAHNVDIEIDI